MGLWSGGPRPILIKTSSGYFFDALAIYARVKTMLFSIDINHNSKGSDFEDIIAALLTQRSIEVLPVREINTHTKRKGKQEKEGDVFVRQSNKLVVIECRALSQKLTYAIPT